MPRSRVRTLLCGGNTAGGYGSLWFGSKFGKISESRKSLSSNKLEALRRIWNLYRKAEGMSVPNSAWHFCFWAVRAVKRRV